MATLTVNGNIVLAGTYVSTSENTNIVETIASTIANEFTNGTGANQANFFFEDRRTTNGAIVTIDLTSTLTDKFGTTAVFSKIKWIAVYNRTLTTAYTLTLSGNAISAFCGGTLPTVVIGPGGFWAQSGPVDGYTITNTTQDQLVFNPGTNSITFDYYIIGIV